MEEITETSALLENTSVMINIHVNNAVSFPLMGHAMLGSLLVLSMVVGICANSVGIVIFYKNKNLRSPTNLFIASLAFCDLLMLVLATPLPTASSFANRWIWGHAGCVFEGFLVFFLGLTSLYLLCAISIDRYIVIAMPLNNALITKCRAICSVLACYGLGFFWATLPLLGWNSYQLEGLMTSCSVLWDTKKPADYSYNVVIFFTCFMLPVIIMSFCYYKVYRTVRAVSRNNQWDINNRMTERKLKVERKISRTILIMIGVFLGCWSPYAIVSFWAAFGVANDIPVGVTGIPPFIAKTSSVWNPIIYICTNRQFRTAFLHILPCVSLRREQAESSEMIHVGSSRVVAIDSPTPPLRQQLNCLTNQNERPHLPSGKNVIFDDVVEESRVEPINVPKQEMGDV
ncbi:visual pigment-like receptor peropsin [Ylistrum balloti]|uniref:visual pigment-like receptor peropsin n=1 Tax=Ylistrum balloti TaxID=509963 RepID=UPI002905DC06|nr:visual pigment-like receptor peropsin [Ylistrum balloti]